MHKTICHSIIYLRWDPDQTKTDFENGRANIGNKLLPDYSTLLRPNTQSQVNAYPVVSNGSTISTHANLTEWMNAQRKVIMAN